MIVTYLIYNQLKDERYKSTSVYKELDARLSILFMNIFFFLFSLTFLFSGTITNLKSKRDLHLLSWAVVFIFGVYLTGFWNITNQNNYNIALMQSISAFIGALLAFFIIRFTRGRTIIRKLFFTYVILETFAYFYLQKSVLGVFPNLVDSLF